MQINDILLILLLPAFSSSLSWMLCKFHKDESISPKWTQVVEEIESRTLLIFDNGTSVKCKSPDDTCATLWLGTKKNDGKKLLLQGCYDQRQEICSKNGCIAERQLSHDVGHNGTSFWCCCQGKKFCNAKNELVFRPHKGGRLREVIYLGKSSTLNVFLLPTILSVFLAGTLLLLIVGYFFARKANENNNVGKSDGNSENTLISVVHPDSLQIERFNLFDPDNLHLADLIGRGRYGTVYRAYWNGLRTAANSIDMAVKVFRDANCLCFRNEVEIYTLPILRNGHENLLKFFAAKEMHNNVKDESKSCTSVEYWLVSEFAKEGTLQDYLKSRTLDWSGFYSITMSILAGLSFLHEERRKDGRVLKPVVVHRDINSRNVLVKADGSAVISDLGFAMALNREHFQTGQEIRLAEVGTVRYLSPEVLEGAVNLHDPTAALMQVDVYATGLLLWEVFHRCHDVWNIVGDETPPYAVPFFDHVTRPPTLEQMQLCVCKKQIRPLFPAPCYLPAVSINHRLPRLICNYIEDCWESDPEGRATMACTFVRFSQLHQTHVQIAARTPMQQNLDGSTVAIASAGLAMNTACNGDNDEMRMEIPVQVQPFQGRNPCQERNTLQDRGSDSGSLSNELASNRVLRRSSFRKVDPNDVNSLTAHLKGTTEGESNRLLEYLHLNVIVDSQNAGGHANNCTVVEKTV